jgi:ribosomal protein L11 methyltransferase
MRPVLRHATALETVAVTVPEAVLEFYEAALATVCGTVGFFFADEDARTWRVEGVKGQGEGESELAAALALAGAASGYEADLERHGTYVDGWLARTAEAFPEQLVGRRFAVRGTHVEGPPAVGRITIRLDAGVAFGSGEHGSTRGCLRALEMIAHRRPRNVLDLGTGSGILAMAAASLLHRPVLGTDIDPWSVRVARENAALNGLSKRSRYLRADGWLSPVLRKHGPYDLVFANILARPLTQMAKSLAVQLRPGGTVILAGLLTTQVRMVLAAHRRVGLILERMVHEDRWTTLVVRKR